jgi:hypothetical protein
MKKPAGAATSCSSRFLVALCALAVPTQPVACMHAAYIGVGFLAEIGQLATGPPHADQKLVN